MFIDFPAAASQALEWSWERFAPYFTELNSRALSAANLAEFLADWERANSLVREVYNRLYVDTTLYTADEAIELRYKRHLEDVYPRFLEADQKLKEKLLDSGLSLPGLEIPLRNLRARANLYREANLPLLAEEQKLNNEYDKLIGAQTVMWDGEERTLASLFPVYLEPDRDRRESAYRLSMARRLEDRQALNELWVKLFQLRQQIAANAGLPDYRAYAWQDKYRFAYTPASCRTFHQAVEAVAVPVARRLRSKRQQRLGVERLRPWDMYVDPFNRQPLKPYQSPEELQAVSRTIFHKVDPALGGYFEQMESEGLLDLMNRKNKGPGAYSIDYPLSRRPFIFMNAVSVHDDVVTILHEGGHAFHAFEAFKLPYHLQLEIPMEFAEVASMSMELLAAPYLAASQGGFYSEADAARARIEHLTDIVLFLPYCALVDAFQHWLYENPEQAVQPEVVEAKYAEIFERYMPGLDMTGLEDAQRTWWHRQLHIFQMPFYYIEYGLAQLGAVQVWRNALSDQPGAVRAYLQALALGGTADLPDLFSAAGARFGFDEPTLRPVVELLESTIERLEK